MKIRKVLCKSILNKSRIYGVDYAINPFTGCQHGCLYCYATFMKKYTSHKEEWGEFVDVKINAPIVLKRQLRRIKKGRVLISSVTDAYQNLEKEFKVTRKCLELLKNSKLEVSILTKSPLVLRDLDLLCEMEIDVGFTITTLDGIYKKFEINAPSPASRLRALEKLSDEGVSTWVFFGPVLPFISDDFESIQDLLSSIKPYVSHITVDKMNLYRRVFARLKKMLSEEYPELVLKYRKIMRDGVRYERELRERIEVIAKNEKVRVEFCF
ncbi:MAG: radical SAM protein [Candidatus Methanofastidiosia archaeon]